MIMKENDVIVEKRNNIRTLQFRSDICPVPTQSGAVV